MVSMGRTMCETGAGGKALVAVVRHRGMRLLIARVLSIAVALGVVTLLVVQATTSGCATHDRQDPWLATQVTATPVPTEPVSSAAEATPPVPPNPVINIGPGYLPATKAAPVFYPSKPVAQPAQQQSQAAPQAPPQGKPR
jgi:hypothetical protein